MIVLPKIVKKLFTWFGRDDVLSLDKIAAAGGVPPELSIEYQQSLDVLDNVVRHCMTVSRKFAGIPSPHGRYFYASVLFTALITRGISLLNLAPHSPWSHKMIEHWDYASAAIIARTMIEIRCAFHYLCVDDCSDEEWNCRWNLLNLHDCISRKRLFEAMPGGTESPQDFDAQAEELRERLRTNSHFSQQRHQKKLLNGQTAYLHPIEDMAERAGIDRNTYRFLHVLFSSHVHGLPMSYYRMAEQERGRGVPSPVEEHYTAICLSCASMLLAASRDEAEHLFGGLK